MPRPPRPPAQHVRRSPARPRWTATRDDAREAREARSIVRLRAIATRDQTGQATVEVVALLPVLAALIAGVWQAALAGHAVWAATAAARAAARAHAVGADPRQAAREHLPGGLERGLRVTTEAGGDVRVTVRIPALPGLPSPGRAHAGAHFEPQS